MLSIALSMPFTTDAMFPDTWRIVTAVSTLLATASTRLASRSRFRYSFFLRIEFAAYIRAPSAFPCCSACISRSIRAYVFPCGLFRWCHPPRFVRVGGLISSCGEREVGCRRQCIRAFLSFAFSVFSSFWAFLACRFSDFAVNCGVVNKAILGCHAWICAYSREREPSAETESLESIR